MQFAKISRAVILSIAVVPVIILLWRRNSKQSQEDMRKPGDLFQTDENLEIFYDASENLLSAREFERLVSFLVRQSPSFGSF